MRQMGRNQNNGARKPTANAFVGYSPAHEALFIRDGNGSCRTVEISQITIQFKDRPDLKRVFENAKMSGDVGVWIRRRAEFRGKSFLDAVKAWAGKDFEKRTIYLAVIFQYVHQTNDSRKYLETIKELKTV